MQDALAFSEHAGHNEVNESDIRLAIEGKTTYSFTNPPSRDVNKFIYIYFYLGYIINLLIKK